MKMFLIVLLALSIFSCTSREKGQILEKGTPNYELATKLAEIDSTLNPDENMVLATTTRHEITVGDVILKMRSRFGKQAENLSKQPAASIKNLIEEYAENTGMIKILLFEAKNKGINVTAAEVDSVLEAQYKQAGGKENLMKILEENGVSPETLHNDFLETETLKRFYKKVREEAVNISEEEIDEAYKNDKSASVRHILLLTKDKTDEQKQELRTQIEGLLERAKAGEDFAELAKQYSEDPGSKEKGGLYEDFPRGQMVPPFDEAAFGVPVGELSDIVETSYGFHILKIEDRKKEDRDRDKVKAELSSKKSQNAVKDSYEALKKEYELTVVIAS
jgi:foldase protein PrsA